MDILHGEPDGTLEIHPGGRHLFRWERTTYQLRPVQDDPDCWIIRGTGGEYRVDLAARSCSCKGHMTHKTTCRHLRAGMAFGAQLGSAGSEDEEEKMTDEELRELFR